MTAAPPVEIQIWPIDRLVLYARNPRKNDAVVDRMCSSIREFGFKTSGARTRDGEVVDGHLQLKAARKLGITEIPVIPLRRVFPTAGQGLSADGESFGDVGVLG